MLPKSVIKINSNYKYNIGKYYKLLIVDQNYFKSSSMKLELWELIPINYN